MTDTLDTAPPPTHAAVQRATDQSLTTATSHVGHGPGRSGVGPGFAVLPPTHGLPVWDRPVPHDAGSRRRPAVWLLGAHGGAGVSTLARVLAPAADCGGRWPGGFAGESPFVVVVARETVPGLVRAHELLRQHAAGLAGPSRLLGVVTVADRPKGRMPTPVRQTRDLAVALAAHAWRVGWIEQYPLIADLADLPAWSPITSPTGASGERAAEPPREVTRLGAAIRDALLAAQHPDREPDTPARPTEEGRH